MLAGDFDQDREARLPRVLTALIASGHDEASALPNHCVGPPVARSTPAYQKVGGSGLPEATDL